PPPDRAVPARFGLLPVIPGHSHPRGRPCLRARVHERQVIASRRLAAWDRFLRAGEQSVEVARVRAPGPHSGTASGPGRAAPEGWTVFSLWSWQYYLLGGDPRPAIVQQRLQNGPRLRRQQPRRRYRHNRVRRLPGRSTVPCPHGYEARDSHEKNSGHGCRCESSSDRQWPPPPALLDRDAPPGDLRRQLLAQRCRQLQRRIGGREETLQPRLLRFLTVRPEGGPLDLRLSLAHDFFSSS